MAKEIVVATAGAGKTTLLVRRVADARAAGGIAGYINLARLRQTYGRLAYAPTISARDLLDTLRDILPGVLALPQDEVTGAFADYSRKSALLSVLVERVLDEQRILGYFAAEVAGRYRAVRAMPPDALIGLCRFWLSLPQRVQDAPDAAAFLKTGLENIITLNAANVGQLRAFIADRLRPALSDDLPLFADPDKTLAEAFASGLAALTTRPLLLALDDYDAIVDTPSLHALAHALNAPLNVVIAGSDGGDWARLYRANGYSDIGSSLPAQNPLAARLGADRVSAGVVSWLEDQDAETKRLISTLVLTRRPDPVLLGRLARRDFVPRPNLNRFSNQPPLAQAQAILSRPVESDALEPYAELRATYPFLFENPDALMPGVDDPATFALELHPAVRDGLRDYLRVERRRFSHAVQEEIVEPARDISQRALDAREADAEGVSLAERARDATWQALTLDVAWYRLWLDEAVAWVYIMPRYLLALAYSADLARGLADLTTAMETTYYNEGVELLPIVRDLVWVAGGDGESGAAGDLDARLKGLESLDQLGQAQRGRWYKQENLGRRTGTAGSEEAEVRGIVFWQMGRAHAAAGRFDRAVQLYEQTLGMNVVMPELRREAARAHLRLAERLLLTGGSGGSGHTGFDPNDALAGAQRATDLWPDFVAAHSDVALLSVRRGQYAHALTATAEAAKGGDPYAPVYAAAALLGLRRLPEATDRARAFAPNDARQRADGLAIFDGLTEALHTHNPDLSDDDALVIRATLEGQKS